MLMKERRRATRLVDPKHLAWPLERLGDALREITGCGAVHLEPAAGEFIDSWILEAAKRAGFNAEAMDDLAGCYPAIIRVTESSYLAVLWTGAKRVTVLTPELKRVNLGIQQLSSALLEPAELVYRPALEALLEDAGLPRRHRKKALQLLLNEQLAGKRFTHGWVLRPDPGGPAVGLLRQAGVLGNAASMIAAHTLQYVLWLLSWGLLGSLSLTGRLDRAWIGAWALLLLTLVPCQIVTTRLQGLFAVGLGGFLKRRLLCGAMKLQPEEMRQGGIGQFLGQALEAEAVESLALSGGIAGLLAIVEILLAMLVLGRFAPVLAAWCAVTVFAGWRFLRRYAEWTETRLDLTEDLVESMVGHRTRLAQLPRGDWHDGEDRALHNYQGLSKSLDETGAWLVAALPRGWLLVGLTCLLPEIAARQSVDSRIGITLGGVLLAYAALRKLTGSFADVAAAWVAFQRIGPLVRAAARPVASGEGIRITRSASRKVVEADRLSFRYRATGKAALQSGSLCVYEGDRILLEGPSGGGKTTFASLISGMREPESGLLLARGLDRNTLGAEEWRKRIAAAPQFHENHILTETLAFNLLLGRNWPPAQSDMAEAETVCRELGLGGLLDRMPGGLMQMVGEGGWQMSHGEKSRVYIARALLQRADMVILDESFAALDPETAKLALEATMARAKTLLVIAHP